MKNLFLALLAVATGLFCTNAASAQSDSKRVIYTTAKFVEVAENSPKRKFRVEFSPADNGKEEVEIYTAKSQKRVASGVQDAANKNRLHGDYTFYYPTGKVESSGEFDNGLKVGAWKRFDKKGVEKPSRLYAEKRRRSVRKGRHRYSS